MMRSVSKLYRTVSQREKQKSFADSQQSANVTFLVSFPRSGSNFFQQILEQQCDFNSTSLYNEENCRKPVQNLKSHAVSPQYLKSEINAILQGTVEIGKVIYLYRDPRDVMISFYNFFLARKQGFVSQGEFLEMDWFLAYSRTGSTKSWLRSTEFNPLSVAAAYKKMTSSWMSSSVLSGESLAISFEELVEHPSQSVNKVASFFGCKVNSQESNEKLEMVAQYSTEKRPRGQAFGWKNSETLSQYSELITKTNSLLHTEIERLGYEV